MHRSNISKVLFQSRGADGSAAVPVAKPVVLPAEETPESAQIGSDWEVLELTAHGSPSPDIIKKPLSVVANGSPSPEIIKKPPPTVKGKPRKAADSSSSKETSAGAEGGENKKVPILPSAQKSSPANVLQKGPTKPDKVSSLLPACQNIQV